MLNNVLCWCHGYIALSCLFVLAFECVEVSILEQLQILAVRQSCRKRRIIGKIVAEKNISLTICVTVIFLCASLIATCGEYLRGRKQGCLLCSITHLILWPILFICCNIGNYSNAYRFSTSTYSNANILPYYHDVMLLYSKNDFVYG